jgi:hypothetical protein
VDTRKRRRCIVFEVNIPGGFTDAGDVSVIEAGREYVFLVTAESTGLGTLAFVVCPELSAISFGNEHDTESRFVTIDII